MKRTLSYGIGEVRGYINWLYFYHAWGVLKAPAGERERLRAEAEERLDTYQGRYRTHGVFGLFNANSDGDDLLIGGVRIPMLRQQSPDKETGFCLCLADFVRPMGTVADKAGAFATSADAAIAADNAGDDYERMMSQTLSDRLAEATAERLHKDVRTTYWGYAPDENLSVEDLFNEKYQGIRPAVGYPSLPDTGANFLLDALLGFSSVGISLTETGMMQPHASVSGFMFSHPKARYFHLGKIGRDQLEDYARRRGMTVAMAAKFLQSNIQP